MTRRTIVWINLDTKEQAYLPIALGVGLAATAVKGKGDRTKEGAGEPKVPEREGRSVGREKQS